MEEYTNNFCTYSEDETIKTGEFLAELLNGDEIILLSGDLGAGKTRFVKGLARGLGISQEITSPTFIIVNEYYGEQNLFHFDLYRLTREEELVEIGFEEYLYREGVVVIEWPELALPFLPHEYIYLNLKVEEANKRCIEIQASDDHYKKIAERLKKNANFRS